MFESEIVYSGNYAKGAFAPIASSPLATEVPSNAIAQPVASTSDAQSTATSDPSEPGLGPQNRPQPKPSEAATSSEATKPSEATAVAPLEIGAALADGTAESVTRLLDLLSHAFGAKVTMGWSKEGRPFNFHTSPAAQPLNEEVLGILRSAITEAATCQSSCFYAFVEKSSSGVLSNLRKAAQATLVLSFGVALSPPAASASPTDQASPPTASEDAAGIVIIVGSPENLLRTDAYVAKAEAIRKQLPAWLAVWQLCALGRTFQGLNAKTQWLRGRKGAIAGCCALLLLGCLAIPVPYRPQRDCVAEPAARAYISSPIEGNMTQALVRPGDVVNQGQLLARIDDENIRWELSSANAELEAAGKRRDSALATRASSDMQLAKLEQERIALRINALDKQLELLELRSPIDGIVVQGDWFQNEGAPVSRGDTIFEIAPLDTMQIETRLSSEDLSVMEVGNTAIAHFDAAQGTRWNGQIERIDPRGQVIDAQVVFLAEMQIANEDNALRPGMRGTVRVSAGQKSLGWLLFHRPYTWVMKKLVW